MTRVFIWPELASARKNHGIGRIVHAQHEGLAAAGIQVVGDPKQADVMACHTQRGTAPRVDILHCHGLYFADLPHVPYSAWHKKANSEIVAAAREALAITVPSDWVAEPFRRDMRLRPVVIPHGVEPELFERIEDDGYILWNKNRNSDVCDPTPALELARRGLSILSTFLPIGGAEKVKTIKVIGQQDWESMRTTVRRAHIYLATVIETFGVGTLEGMAAGLPVLGYAWGGTADLVRHQVEGWLAAPGDIDGLIEGASWIEQHYDEVSRAAAKRASEFTWDKVMRQYAQLYEWAAEERSKPIDKRVTVVIPSYNYARFLPDAVKSVVEQSQPPAKVIIVDDGSKDETPEVGKALAAKYPMVEYIPQKNQGVASARNRGVAQAQTPFVLCLDADDWLDRHFLEACVNALAADRGLGIAYTGLVVHYPDGMSRQFAWPPEFSWEIQAKAHVPPSNCVPSASVFRRAMWQRAGGYQQPYAPGEDADFWTRGLSVGFKALRVTDIRMFHYRAHGASASRTKRYVPTDDHAPWMRDRQYPMAAPAEAMPDVRCYALPAVSILVRGRSNDDWQKTIDDVLGQTVRQWELWLIASDGLPPRILEVHPFARVVDEEAKVRPRAPYLIELRAGDSLLPIALERELREATAGKLNGRSRLKENTMACCGGDKAANKRVLQEALGMAVNIPGDAKVDGSGYVRLEYIGVRSGAVTYHGLAGRAYRGGNNPMRKYINAHIDDIGLLVATGQWRIVTQIQTMPTAEIHGVSEKAKPLPEPAAEVSVNAPAAKTSRKRATRKAAA